MAITEKFPYRLTVLLITFNHQSHIQQALDSLFNQMIKGPIELVIADDASNDATLELIKIYEKKDARFIFHYLPTEENQGITKNYQRGFAACSGQYVMVLEGDDYWISPFKAQRQIDFLEAHWECDLCASNYFILDESRSEFQVRSPFGSGYTFLSARNLIADNLVGNFSTCMYRNTALKALPNALFDMCSYDWIVNICIAKKSLIGFLEEPMSVYRVHENGVWSKTSRLEKLEVQLALIPKYDLLTQKVFHEEFRLLKNQLQHAIKLSEIKTSLNGLTHLKKIKFTVKRILLHSMDFLPPIVVSCLHALVPPKLKRFIQRIF